jgi:hypothetical protein
MPDPASVAVALAAWRAAHPTATLAEIAAAVDHHLSAERAALIADLASVQPDDRPACPQCGTAMVHNGTRTETVTTAHEGSLPLTGPSMFARPVGPGFSPLAERLALVPGQLSPTLAALAVRFGLTGPFQRAATLLSAACGTRVSADTVRRLTEAAGDAWWPLELTLVTDLETAARTPGGAPVVLAEAQPLDATKPAILELDGAMVPLVHGEWAEARTLVIGTQDGATTTALSYVSQLASAATFARSIRPELTRRGVAAHPGPVVAVTDGAIWIQELLDLHCPQAVRVLDIMHAAGYLAQARFGPGTERTSEWFAIARTALRRGDADTTLAMLAALPASPERDRARHYLGQRRSMLAYDRCDAAGWPVGSGAVESANKSAFHNPSGGGRWLKQIKAQPSVRNA